MKEIDPSTRYNLRLNIPDGQTVELALFQALLLYAEGVAVIILVNDDYLMHGRETCELIVGPPAIEGIKARVMHLKGDTEAIHDAFNAEDCDWPEMLGAARKIFMERGEAQNESYVAWLKHEIRKRGGEIAA